MRIGPHKMPHLGYKVQTHILLLVCERGGKYTYACSFACKYVRERERSQKDRKQALAFLRQQ